MAVVIRTKLLQSYVYTSLLACSSPSFQPDPSASASGGMHCAV